MGCSRGCSQGAARVQSNLHETKSASSTFGRSWPYKSTIVPVFVTTFSTTPCKAVVQIKNRPLKYLEDKATTFYYCKSTGIPYRQYSTVVESYLVRLYSEYSVSGNIIVGISKLLQYSIIRFNIF